MKSISSLKGGSLICHIGALVTVIAWGASFISTKVLLDSGLHPVEIYIYRFVLAYFMVLLICHDRFFSNSLKDEGLFALIGLCAGSIYFIAENTALQYTLVSNVSLITSMSPLLTAILIGILYRNERPQKEIIYGSLVAFIGVGCVIFNSSFVLEINPLGDFLSLFAAISWSVYSIILKKLNAVYSSLYITRKTFFYGVLTALPFLAVEPEISSPSLLLETPVWTNILFLGVFASMIAYVLWAIVVGKLGAVKASNYLYFQPVVTLILSALVLRESVTPIGYIGCGLILAGVWLSDYLCRRKTL
jgi:Permeases of the drug/metabolite transporter (DMT) superfamily